MFVFLRQRLKLVYWMKIHFNKRMHEHLDYTS